MKTIKKVSKLICSTLVENKYKSYLLIIFLLTNVLLFGQANPGGDPILQDGMNAPLDGGIIVAILAGGGLIAAFFKKKKEKE
jgi:hypothetical protein